MATEAEIAQAFTTNEICPQIIPNPPKQKLTAVFNMIESKFGNKFNTGELKNSPKILFDAADPDAMYSLVMIDPDNLSREKPTVAEWLHWMVLNVPASNLKEGIMGGQCIMPYGSPAPQPRTGQHRYLLLMWEHAGRRVGWVKPDQRAKFKVKAFQEKLELGDPIAGNFFFSENRG